MKIHARDRRHWFAVHFGNTYTQSAPLINPSLGMALALPCLILLAVCLMAAHPSSALAGVALAGVPVVSDVSIKEVAEELQKSLHDFRQYVDKELKEIKEKGVADPTTVDTIHKLNDRIDTLQAKISRPALPRDDKAAIAEDRKELADFLRRGSVSEKALARQKAMSEGSDADGGFFVSPDTSGRIITKLIEMTPLRGLANVISTGKEKVEGIVDRDDAGGGWVSETGSRSDTTTPAIQKYEIPVHEMHASPKQTQNLIDDGDFDVAAWLEQRVGVKFATLENAGFITGTGAGQPRGFTTYTTAATADSSRTWGQIEHVATGTAGDWTAANVDKIFDLESALKQGYRQGAAFLGPKSVLLKVRKMKTGDGQFLWQPGLQAGKPSLLIGYPYNESEDMPAIAANSLSLAFANWQEAYTIVDRRGIRVLRDPFSSKPYVVFYTTKRVGGAVLNFDAIKMLKFAAS